MVCASLNLIFSGSGIELLKVKIGIPKKKRSDLAIVISQYHGYIIINIINI